jgi:hypothetical protein
MTDDNEKAPQTMPVVDLFAREPYVGTVKPLGITVDGDKIIQVFEFVDGPRAGQITTLVTRIGG